MYELLYTSVSAKGLNAKMLAEIQHVSKLNNQLKEITGMLVYYDREIMQLLEGEESDVKALYEKIRKDERHTLIHVFYQGNISERAFGNWSMEAVALNAEQVRRHILNDQEMQKQTPLNNMIKENPNRGKKTFLSLRDSLF